MINRNRKQAGFSLLELLIVVAIILVIAAIAIPNLLKAKIAANQASAASNVRMVVGAQNTYRSGQTPQKFAATLVDLATDGQIDAKWQVAAVASTGTNGYQFTMTQQAGDDFFVTATPVSASSGKNTYCVNEKGTLHVDVTGGVIATSGACDTLAVLGS